MSTICTCGNSNKTTGFACNYSKGCPYNEESIRSACSCGLSKPCTKSNCNYGFTHDRVVDLNKITPSIDPIEIRALVNKAANRNVSQTNLTKDEYEGKVEFVADKICLEWETKCVSSLPNTPKGWLKLFAVDKETRKDFYFESDRRIKIELPNGDIFKIDYDNARQMLTINKDSDREGAITIQPGGGVNQIYIK